MAWRRFGLAVGVMLALALPAAAQQTGEPPPPGTVLLADDFDDPDAGWLPTSSPQPDRYLRGYEDGEYFIQKTTRQPEAMMAISASLCAEAFTRNSPANRPSVALV